MKEVSLSNHFLQSQVNLLLLLFHKVGWCLFLCLFGKGRAGRENKLCHPTPFLWYQSQSPEVPFLSEAPHTWPFFPHSSLANKNCTLPSPNHHPFQRNTHSWTSQWQMCVHVCKKQTKQVVLWEMWRSNATFNRHLRASSVNELPKVVVKCHRKRNTASFQEHPSNPGGRWAGGTALLRIEVKVSAFWIQRFINRCYSFPSPDCLVNARRGVSCTRMSLFSWSQRNGPSRRRGTPN